MGIGEDVIALGGVTEDLDELWEQVRPFDSSAVVLALEAVPRPLKASGSLECGNIGTHVAAAADAFDQRVAIGQRRRPLSNELFPLNIAVEMNLLAGGEARGPRRLRTADVGARRFQIGYIQQVGPFGFGAEPSRDP